MKTSLTVLLLVCIAGAQEPAPSGEITIKSYTKLVQVPVVVTDRKGLAVRGLTQGDFELFENGKKVRISTFQSPAEAALATAAVTGSGAREVSPGIYTNAGTADTTRPTIIFVIDAVNTPFLAQVQARKELLKLLAGSIPPDTQLSLMMVTRQGLRVVHEHTRDSQVLIEALKRVTQGSDAIDSSVTAPSTDSGGSQATPGALGPPASTETAQVLRDMILGPVEFADLRRSTYSDLTLQSLRQIAQRFSGVPGRKSLLWAAGNFPFYGDDRTSINSSDIDGRYVGTFELLNDASISVYPVDAGGLVPLYEVTPWNTGKQNPATFRNYRTPGGELIGGRGDTALGQLNTTPDPVDMMKAIAELTGGTAYYRTNDLANMLRKAIGDSSDFYTLGYYLPGGGDAKPGRRELRVTVPGKDVKVRSRTRVFVTRDSFSPREEIAAALRSPLPAVSLPLQVKWDASPAASPFIISIDPKTVELAEPTGRLDLTVVVQARTAEGKIVSQLDKTLSGNIANAAEFKTHPFEYRDALAEFSGPATVRFVVRDNNSGRVGSVIVEVGR